MDDNTLAILQSAVEDFRTTKSVTATTGSFRLASSNDRRDQASVWD